MSCIRRKQRQESGSSEDGVNDDSSLECLPVLQAAEKGDTRKLKDLLDLDPDLVNCRDSDDYTPLHRAAYNGHVRAVELLLEKGADPHARTSDGWQPLHSAVKWSHAQVACLLLSAGADINAQTNGGQTPAHIVSMGKDRNIIQFVIFHPDVDLSIRNSSQELPYDVAKRCSPWHKLYDCTERVT